MMHFDVQGLLSIHCLHDNSLHSTQGMSDSQIWVWLWSSHQEKTQLLDTQELQVIRNITLPTLLKQSAALVGGKHEDCIKHRLN